MNVSVPVHLFGSGGHDPDDAAKMFGGTQALAGASLSVQPGELVSLLGPNGAGKTTMIKAIAGRVELDSA